MTQRELLEAAVALRAAQPELWDRFVAAVNAAAAGYALAMVRCDPALLMRAQGMAMAAQELATILKTAPVLLEKLKGPKNG